MKQIKLGRMELPYNLKLKNLNSIKIADYETVSNNSVS